MLYIIFKLYRPLGKTCACKRQLAGPPIATQSSSLLQSESSAAAFLAAALCRRRRKACRARHMSRFGSCHNAAVKLENHKRQTCLCARGKAALLHNAVISAGLCALHGGRHNSKKGCVPAQAESRLQATSCSAAGLTWMRDASVCVMGVCLPPPPPPPLPPPPLAPPPPPPLPPAQQQATPSVCKSGFSLGLRGRSLCGSITQAEQKTQLLEGLRRTLGNNHQAHTSGPHTQGRALQHDVAHGG